MVTFAKWQELIGNENIKFPLSLNDLGTATLSTAMASCSTPGSLIVKSFADKTPRSTCGSSMFSPGEGFWSEAIKLADGLCAPNNGSVCHAVPESTGYLRSTNGDKKEGAQHDGDSSAHFNEMRNLASQVKCPMELDKAGSPLPVKHFDFSFEDRSLDMATGHHRNLNKTIVVSSRFKSTLTHCTNVQKTEDVHEKQEIAVKSDLYSENDKIGTDPPVNVLRSLAGNHGNDEACTPSSFLQNKDWLDLSSWLPSQICSIYKKKGIQKLYQWQVF